MSSFYPTKGSRDTLVSLSGASLLSVSGVYLISGGTGAQATLVSTSTNLITFYPPSIAPSGIRSGLWSIYNKFGNATTTSYWTVQDPLYISGIAPISGFSGTAIRLSGSGIRDISGLYFSSIFGTYTGVMTDPVFESSTWIRTGIVPWTSGGLNAFFVIKGISEGGSSNAPQLFYLREDGLTLSGFSDFPIPFQPLNYLRENAGGTSLEWRTPNQVLNDITGVLKSGGDHLTGNYHITGGALYLTGLVFQNTGLSTGDSIFRSTIYSGNYLVLDALVGGISWRCFSLKIS